MKWLKWRARHRVRWRLVLVTVLAVGLPLVLGGWAGERGLTVAGHLTRARALLGQLHTELAAGQVPAARTTLAALRRETAAAVDQVRDPGWWLAGRLPLLGDDVAAVATVATVLDGLVSRGLPSLLDAAGWIRPTTLAPRPGRVETDALESVADELATTDAAMREALQRVEAIPAAGTHPRVKAGIAELRAGLRRATAITGTAARASAMLPAVLGARKERTYLVLFQNLAEPRSTGGMPGAFIVVSAKDGAVRVIDQGSGTGMRPFARPVMPVGRAMRALYSERLGIYPADVNFTPHFPTTATLIREMYRRRTGRSVDGVISTDPVALSYLLRATGPVRAPGGVTLTAGNAVRVLLADAYARTDSNVEQDRFFATVTRAVFNRIVRFSGDPRAMLAQLVHAAGERRILAWSAQPGEQRLISGTVLEGALPPRDGGRPNIGVFLNDGGGSKLGYYLTRGVEVGAGRCRADGRREMTVRVTLGSTAPRSGLSKSVVGMGLAGHPYTIRTNVMVFSPARGTVREPKLDGNHVGFLVGAERGRAVGVVTVDLRPGRSRTLEMTVLTAEGVTPQPALTPRLWLTPGTTPWVRNVQSPAPC